MHDNRRTRLVLGVLLIIAITLITALAFTIPKVPVTPILAVLEDGYAVSICFSARRSAVAADPVLSEQHYQ